MNNKDKFGWNEWAHVICFVLLGLMPLIQYLTAAR